MLLAAAASILIGMEGAAVQRTLHDQSVQQAMLVARRILATVESADPSIEIQSLAGVSATQALQTLNAPQATDPREQRALDRIQVTMEVQQWQLPIPKIEENPLRRLELKLSWGDQPDENFVVTYFIPAPSQQP